MDYQQARQETCPVRMPKQAASRQLKPVTDNRPEAAAQRRLLEGMARGNEVAQRMCGVALLTQNGANCGLFSLKMAITALGAQPGKSLPTDEDYDNAAEVAGSNVGEIFSSGVMQTVITCLGYNSNIHLFTNAAGLAGALGATGSNPVLIAFSNFAYRTLRGETDTGNQHHTQRGHWSVVESLTSGILTMVNPNGYKNNISLDNMYQANQAMDGMTLPSSSGVAIGSQSGNGKSFDWTDFVSNAYKGMDGRVYVLQEDGSNMKRTIVKGGLTVATIGSSTVDMTNLFYAIKTAAKGVPKTTAINDYLTAANTLGKIHSVATYTPGTPGTPGTLNNGTQDNTAETTGIPKQQPLDLNGYIVEIRT